MAHESFRIEKDSLGEVRVPANALYMAQTQRAVENFPISGLRFGRPFIRALGIIKSAAAVVNSELGILDSTIASAIEQAAAEVAEGRHDEHFPIDIFQTGSGPQVVAALKGGSVQSGVLSTGSETLNAEAAGYGVP